MDTSIEKLLKTKRFLFWINAHTPVKKQSSQDGNTPIHLKNNAPHIKVTLIFWFLIMTFNLCFHHQLWVKWYVYILAIVLVICDELIHNSPNACGCLTVNEMHIKLASLIISSTSNNLTNSPSTPLPEVKKSSAVYSSYINFVYLNRSSINWKFKG